MRIAQYGIAQAARNSSYREHRVTRSLKQVKDPSTNALVFSDVLKEEKDTEEDGVIQLKTRWDLIETLMAILSNQQVNFHNPWENIRGGRSMMVTEITESVLEHASMVFTSTGVVHTESGEKIDFTYNIKFSKTYLDSVSSYSAFGGKLIDPLVFNLDNRGLDLTDKTIQMDLDLDGHMDTFNMLQSGSGFLVLDKNGNHKVDDGSELFGPQTDDGFAELKVYDGDGNLWIDENDEIYKDLKIWTIDNDGKETLIPLKEVGVGAIFLDHVDSHFDLEDASRKGRITHSGVYLKENGQVGPVHEIKL